MRISLAQLNPTLGDIEYNISKIDQALAEAQANGAELVVFPEMALTGYPIKGQLTLNWMREAAVEGRRRLEALSEKYSGLGFICGFPTAAPNGRWYNSAGLFYQGQLAFVQHKTVLSPDGCLNEESYFVPGTELNTIEFGGEVLGLVLGDEFLDDVVKQGATIGIYLAASPFYAGRPKERTDRLRALAESHGIPMVFVNQVGGQDELIFDGGSMYCDGEGRLAAFGFFTETSVMIDTKAEPPQGEDIPGDNAATIYAALKLGLSDYMKKCRQTKVVMGLSGGIDSAVLCALTADTLGPENVWGVAMPGPFSSPGSITDATALAENLGIRFNVVPISPLYQSYLDSLEDIFAGSEPNVAEENIQARIRGNILMAISNKFGGMVLVPSNKSEAAVGYATLYGDMSGGLAPLADVYKTTIYELAEYINRSGEIIPQNTITKAPSAELRPNQKDSDSLPVYDVLDPIIAYYVEEGMTIAEIAAQGFPKETVEKVVRLINWAEFKRRQAAPNLRVSKKPFGLGWKMPLTAKYEV
jgi:NAD+ synthase (glutamine-hydrolysing)